MMKLPFGAAADACLATTPALHSAAGAPRIVLAANELLATNAATYRIPSS